MAMAMDDAALQALGQFLNTQTGMMQQTTEKMPALDDLMQKMFGGGNMPPVSFNANSQIPEIQPATESSGSASPRNDSPNSEEQQQEAAMLLGSLKEPRNYRLEPWHECFTTTSPVEFEALIYSVYVLQREDKKLDGYDYYECINRLQSKCRYRVRSKRVNEFFIVEEKGAHNHAMEPVGSPGSHAGLPKTLREIVDRSFHEDWPHGQRQTRLDEEVRRLGLPHNPRLNRQVDNRIAYLRRVKNLTEMRKHQEAMVLKPQMNMMQPKDMNGLAQPNPDDFMRKMMQMGGPEMQDPSRLIQMMMSTGQLPNIDMSPQVLSQFSQEIPLEMKQDPIQPEVENHANQHIQEELNKTSNCSTPEARLTIKEE